MPRGVRNLTVTATEATARELKEKLGKLHGRLREVRSRAKEQWMKAVLDDDIKRVEYAVAAVDRIGEVAHEVETLAETIEARTQRAEKLRAERKAEPTQTKGPTPPTGATGGASPQ